MFHGFYNLTSGMLTHGRMLDVLSNNIGNVSTPGFKVDRYTATTFEEVMWSHVGNRRKVYNELGEMSWITAPDQLYTDYTQGAFDETGLALDFAIEGSGYFAVETENGRVYTRNGNFALDNEGYLSLPGQGRVQSADGEDILLTTDRVTVDNFGRLFTENGGYLGRLGVFAFEDETVLEKNDQGVFVTDTEPEPTNTPRIFGGMLERSNVDWVQQMTQMISTQRAYQSAVEVIKIYDDMITKASTDVGRLV